MHWAHFGKKVIYPIERSLLKRKILSSSCYIFYNFKYTFSTFPESDVSYTTVRLHTKAALLSRDSYTIYSKIINLPIFWLTPSCSVYIWNENACYDSSAYYDSWNQYLYPDAFGICAKNLRLFVLQQTLIQHKYLYIFDDKMMIVESALL